MTARLVFDPALAHAVSPHELGDYIDRRIADEAAAARAEALELIRAGRPGYAHFKLARSVERQARIAGIHAHLPCSTVLLGGSR